MEEGEHHEEVDQDHADPNMGEGEDEDEQQIELSDE
jgi:hypothetical protein